MWLKSEIRTQGGIRHTRRLSKFHRVSNARAHPTTSPSITPRRGIQLTPAQAQNRESFPLPRPTIHIRAATSRGIDDLSKFDDAQPADDTYSMPLKIKAYRFCQTINKTL